MYARAQFCIYADTVLMESRAAPALLARFALAPDAAVRAHAFASTISALPSYSVMLADTRAPAVLAVAPAAVMLADAGAPAVLAVVPRGD